LRGLGAGASSEAVSRTDSTRRTEGLADRPRAVVVAVQLPGVTDEQLGSSLAELERLAATLGLEVVGRVTQRRDRLAAAAVLGEGKLEELARWTGGPGYVPNPAPKKRQKKNRNDGEPATGEGTAPPGASAKTGDDVVDDALPEEERVKLVLVDHELTPSQSRNLEKATTAEVVDRTSVILRIFQRHARTREARLQVELARLAYEAPRLRETGGGGDRQRGGVGGKGAGESALELDRRRIRDRMAELRRELERAGTEDAVRRVRRVERGDTVALVGYTNAGKSSWFRRLTGGDVYVADELFATLDTTVRALVPETRPRVIVSDTVGFIKKLPHDLVASFRSTLDEAREASLLLHVVDASDPAWREQLEVTREVLGELGLVLRPWGGEEEPTRHRAARGPLTASDVLPGTATGERPCLILLNKADRLDDDARAALAVELPDALMVSARDDDDLAAVHARIVAFFEASMEDAELFIPWAEHARVHAIHEAARVLGEDHEPEGTRLRVRAPAPTLARLRGA